jgi:hypothetical protein
VKDNEMKKIRRGQSERRRSAALRGCALALMASMAMSAALAQTAPPAQVVGPAPGTGIATDPAPQPPPPQRTREILDIQMRSRFQTPPPSSRLESGEAAAIYKHHVDGIGKEPLKPKDEPKRN